MGSDGRTAESAWTPLSHPVFRALWIASLVSNIGTWMQNVSAAWAMTSLSPSPFMVALVQSATSLPVFVVGLPAGGAPAKACAGGPAPAPDAGGRGAGGAAGLAG